MPQDFYDITIVGGGPIGVTVGCAIAQAGLRVIVLDKQAVDTPIPDGRLVAIAHASRNILKNIGVWLHTEEAAAPIDRIEIIDGHSTGRASYDHQLIGSDPMGYMVEMPKLRQALYQRSLELENFHWKAPCSIEKMHTDEFKTSLTLNDGTTIESKLIIGADGRFSWVRDQMGIKLTKWKYTQKAIVCAVEHELAHENVAYERFLPGGPFAILPNISRNDKHLSSIVWAEDETIADDYLNLSEHKFSHEIQRRAGDHLGKIKAVGKRWSYPLGVHYVNRYINHRSVLVGDAAHGVHPVAGQGLNMGFKDVAALVDVLVEGHQLGMDLGDKVLLEKYQRWRRFDNLMMIGAMDGLIKLFSNDYESLKFLRRNGLRIVERFPLAKKIFMKSAMGITGDVPSLIRSE